MGDQLERVGAIIDTDTIKFENVNDLFNLISRGIRANFTNALGDLAKQWSGNTDSMEPFIKRLNELIREGVVKLVNGVKDVVRFFIDWQDVLKLLLGTWLSFKAAVLVQTVVTAFAGLTTAIKAANTATATWNATLRLNPIGLIVTAIGAAITAIIVFSDEISAIIRKARELLGLTKEGVAGDIQDTQREIDRLKNTIADVPNGATANLKRLNNQLADAEKRLRNLIQDSASASAARLPGPAIGAPGALGFTSQGAVAKAAANVADAGNTLATNIKMVSDRIVRDAGVDTPLGQLTLGGRAQLGDGTVRGSRLVGDAGLAENPLGQITPPELGALAIAQLNQATADALETSDAKTNFGMYASSLTDTIGNALQGSLQAGTFKGFLKKILAGFVSNLQNALQGALSGGGGVGGAGGFFKGLLTGSFGGIGSDHEGRFGSGSANRELLRVITADESVLKPDQLAAVYRAGQQTRSEGNITINQSGVDYSLDYQRRLQRSGLEIGQLYRRQLAEGNRG